MVKGASAPGGDEGREEGCGGRDVGEAWAGCPQARMESKSKARGGTISFIYPL